MSDDQRQHRSSVLVVYDWRAAARTTEQSSDLQPVDHALTATGLAAEIRDRFGPPT